MVVYRARVYRCNGRPNKQNYKKELLKGDKKMVITSTLEQDNLKYYRVKFANVSHDVYEWAPSARVAIMDALDNLLDDGHPEPLGNAAARPAVYKEWNHSAWRYKNDGTFIGDLTPCNTCQVPIDTETHHEELGLCLKCSNEYFSHVSTCAKCLEDYDTDELDNNMTCEECLSK